MTVEEFSDLVKSHDMAYEFSDDAKTWRKGFSESRLISEARETLGDDICVPIWNKAVDECFSPESRSRFYWKNRKENANDDSVPN